MYFMCVFAMLCVIYTSLLTTSRNNARAHYADIRKLDILMLVLFTYISPPLHFFPPLRILNVLRCFLFFDFSLQHVSHILRGIHELMCFICYTKIIGKFISNLIIIWKSMIGTKNEFRWLWKTALFFVFFF